MKYLVLRRFRTYGRTYKKGEIVDEEFIKAPRLRVSEGKIIPAVSSFEVPVEIEPKLTNVSTVPLKESNKEELKVEPKKELKAEPKKELKTEPKKELKTELKKELKTEPKKELKAEPKKELKAAPKKSVDKEEKLSFNVKK